MRRSPRGAVSTTARGIERDSRQELRASYRGRGEHRAPTAVHDRAEASVTEHRDQPVREPFRPRWRSQASVEGGEIERPVSREGTENGLPALNQAFEFEDVPSPVGSYAPEKSGCGHDAPSDEGASQ